MTDMMKYKTVTRMKFFTKGHETYEEFEGFVNKFMENYPVVLLHPIKNEHGNLTVMVAYQENIAG